MRALITGARGTVGAVLAQRIAERGGHAMAWDRSEAPPGDESRAVQLLERTKPDTVFHVALPSQPTGLENEGWIVNEKWTTDIGRLTAELGIPMVYVSTVMVFTNKHDGPFSPEHRPDETEGYGLSKIQGEAAARGANPAVRVARLGWQIGREPVGNNMLFYLEKQLAETGEITASTNWIPATSFLDDTADALLTVAQSSAGTYHIDSNRGWNFFEIVRALSHQRGANWKIRATDDYSHVQRMTDPRLAVASLATRLPTLSAR